MWQVMKDRIQCEMDDNTDGWEFNDGETFRYSYRPFMFFITFDPSKDCKELTDWKWSISKIEERSESGDFTCWSDIVEGEAATVWEAFDRLSEAAYKFGCKSLSFDKFRSFLRRYVD